VRRLPTTAIGALPLPYQKPFLQNSANKQLNSNFKKIIKVAHATKKEFKSL
jgi:hypothetical protein